MLILFVSFSQIRQLPILERFALLISITGIWAYACLLTASGAYKHHPKLTQINRRTDKAYLISSTPWFGPQMVELERQRWASKGVNITYQIRETRGGYKAGALQEVSYVKHCEYVPIFYADFQP